MSDVKVYKVEAAEQGRKSTAAPRPGWPRGQAHWLAKLSDNDVALIRQLHEVDGWGYRAIAKKFEMSRGHVRYICQYKRRA